MTLNVVTGGCWRLIHSVLCVCADIVVIFSSQHTLLCTHHLKRKTLTSNLNSQITLLMPSSTTADSCQLARKRPDYWSEDRCISPLQTCFFLSLFNETDRPLETDVSVISILHKQENDLNIRWVWDEGGGAS